MELLVFKMKVFYYFIFNLFIISSASSQEPANPDIISGYNQFTMSLGWFQSTIDSSDGTNGINALKVSNNNYSFTGSYLFHLDRTLFLGGEFGLTTYSYKTQENVTFTNTKLRPLSLGLKYGIIKNRFQGFVKVLFWEEPVVQRISLSQVELVEEAVVNAYLDLRFRIGNSIKLSLIHI